MWDINFLFTFEAAPFFCVCPVHICLQAVTCDKWQTRTLVREGAPRLTDNRIQYRD
jgi:hypothetical protein